MASHFATSAAARLLNPLDNVRPRMAKAVSPAAEVAAKKIDKAAWAALVGHIAKVALDQTGWSQKETAARLGIDESEVTRLCNGERPGQFYRVVAQPECQYALVLALAGASGKFDVETQLRSRGVK